MAILGGINPFIAPGVRPCIRDPQTKGLKMPVLSEGEYCNRRRQDFSGATL